MTKPLGSVRQGDWEYRSRRLRTAWHGLLKAADDLVKAESKAPSAPVAAERFRARDRLRRYRDHLLALGVSVSDPCRKLEGPGDEEDADPECRA